MLTTEKEVFEEVKRRLLLEDSNKNYFIRDNLENIRREHLITYDLWVLSRALLEKHKPKSNEFAKNKYWSGGIRWWDISLAKRKNEIHVVIQEKIKFLDYLISKLD